MKYSQNEQILGLGQEERRKFARLLQDTKGVITVENASKTWSLNRSQAAKILSWYNKKGWLRRISQGVYIPVPLSSETRDVIPEEPFVVAAELFAPCYIGGMNAANYWDLTEQIFQSITVMTSKIIAKRNQIIAGTEYKIHTLKPEAFFGLKSIWFGEVKVKISDPTRTLVDMLMYPQFCGGIAFISDVLQNYLASEQKDIDCLIDYLKKANNGAALKRLGFLLEANESDELDLMAYLQDNLTQGYAKLNPEQECPRLIRKWRIWVPESWKNKYYDR